MRISKSRAYRTSEIAQALGVHCNTVRLYESRGYLPPVSRSPNGYRCYEDRHLQHARLAHLCRNWPYLGPREPLDLLVRSAATGDFESAQRLAQAYHQLIVQKQAQADQALQSLESWAQGQTVCEQRTRLTIAVAAEELEQTRHTLRHWERNGLLSVSRNPNNGYRQYTQRDLDRLRVVATLGQSGFSLAAIRRMLEAYDSGRRHGLAANLELSLQESGDPRIEVIADRWISSLSLLQSRAQQILRQLEILQRL